MVGRNENSFLHHLLNAKGEYTNASAPPSSFTNFKFNFRTFSQIEGIFEMTTPNILLGYSKQPVIWPDSSVERVPEIRSSVYLTISISLEPLIDPVELTTSNLECTELSDVKVFLLYSPNINLHPWLYVLNFRIVCTSGIISSWKNFRIVARTH